jgi:hypothetical protein
LDVAEIRVVAELGARATSLNKKKDGGEGN